MIWTSKCDLCVVRDVTANGAEVMVLLTLLFEPDKARGAVVTDLDDVV